MPGMLQSAGSVALSHSPSNPTKIRRGWNRTVATAEQILQATAPIIKASKLAKAAKANDWHGRFDSEVIDGERITTLEVTRSDEYCLVMYRDNSMVRATYSILGHEQRLHCASVALEKLEGWPDLVKLFKLLPKANRPILVDRYRRLPFTFDEPNEDIIAKLLGQKIFWYNHESAKLWCDVVLQPRKSDTKNFRIADVGHRKLFHFIGAQSGFRSVLLDTLIKVG